MSSGVTSPRSNASTAGASRRKQATHPVGKHKARVFASVLGLTDADAEHLRNSLLEAAHTLDATTGETDEYGQRYVMDSIVVGPAGQATVRSSWIVRADEDFPRLVTCFLL
jgi:hypothetical protein